jgi:phage recombination protein Bet
MAVKNKLIPQKAENKTVEYTAGNEVVKLSSKIIKDYLISGDAEQITDQEIVMFLNLCRYQRLNPFLREAYLIKYGNKPATIVTGKDAFLKRASRNDKLKGFEAGVVVKNGDEIIYRTGSLVLKGEEIVGGWAKVYIAENEVPIESSVSFDEYVGRKSNGEINSQWKSKPATMIRKVALVQALREAFPDDFSGMYAGEEMGIDDTELSDIPVEAPEELIEVEAETIDDPFAE